ncbi:trehalase isoform X2 [Plutella xylostella]|uniref:trehalase isoform X2 n=1 Tax=Plutella xylostella TaxID=51655 RepID=UPI002032EAAC|nr:trehalase isoform X2 [Plutella xylostella]
MYLCIDWKCSKLKLIFCLIIFLLCIVMLVAGLVLGLALGAGAALPPSCSRPLYCGSDLLHTVQLANIFQDSKTFVDLALNDDEQTILDKFDSLMNETARQPTREQLQAFVQSNFHNGSELEAWSPPDHAADPAFLAGVRDPALRQFAADIHAIWPTLGRRIRPEVLAHPDRYSLIPVTHPFIVPGGRFKEIYYWDTYWIIEGLLISGMRDTARGMIENLVELLRAVGHVPNGGRCYYEQRSQPPLLSAMVALYFRETRDVKFLKQNIDALETEIKYWLDTQAVTFEKDGKKYSLLRYYAPSEGPRPESYSEDYENAQSFDSEERRAQFYLDIKSAAESGWDFSSRWFVGPAGGNAGNLTTVHTSEIIPVDQNAIFANALQNLAMFHAVLMSPRKAAQFAFQAKQWRDAMDQVLWHEQDGIWYDYNHELQQHRRYFYPSNVAPLWMGVVDRRKIRKRAGKILAYLTDSKGLDYPGGVPTSLINSGEQWDFPNAWPPLVSIMVNALEALGSAAARREALAVAQTWVRACHAGFSASRQMFEKYDAEQPGRVGGGGEYTVQTGFGWSNGVVLEFLNKYGQRLTASDPAAVAPAVAPAVPATPAVAAA